MKKPNAQLSSDFIKSLLFQFVGCSAQIGAFNYADTFCAIEYRVFNFRNTVAEAKRLKFEIFGQ